MANLKPSPNTNRQEDSLPPESRPNPQRSSHIGYAVVSTAYTGFIMPNELSTISYNTHYT